ncbi:MAG: efflux RND transporter periplasmic adaptor subunit [Muribaculaceae bacterium]|nr:efflux RND transporter periplasmic adaptor subunit [Muribaculaceae bacterium]
MKIQPYILIAAGMLAGGSLLFPSCSKKEDKQAEQPVPELAVITVGEQDASLESGYPATLHGENDVEIRPQVTGFLTKVNVQEGQRVSAGQVLFTIDQVSLQAAVDAAQSAVAVAQANVNTAQTNANNNKLLFEKNIISAPAYQTSVDALNAAKAQLNSANAQLVSARKNLSYSVVKAPTSGVVGSIDFKEGALVSPQTLLTVLSDNGDVEAYFSLNEKEIYQLTDGGKKTMSEALKTLPAVTLQLANGERYARPGKIISVSGVLDPSTGSATVKALFPNPDGMLRSGNTARVMIPTLSRDAILIPQKATYEMQDMKFCYVLGDSSKVHSTPITISQENDGKNYIVTGGLKPGDQVVVEGVGISVKEGMTIKPKK